MKKKNYHDGHRNRMRDRIRRDGLESLRDHEVLEFLLYAVIPRVDTNPIAHELIDEFGSFAGVLEADPERLEHKLSKNASLFLTSLPQVFSCYERSMLDEKVLLTCFENCKNYFLPRMRGLTVEKVYLACLTSSGKLKHLADFGEGTVGGKLISVGELVDCAMKHKAHSVILVHNHPSGECEASADDEKFTNKVCVAFMTVGIMFRDHIIIADNDAYSFHRNGKLSNKDGHAVTKFTGGYISDVSVFKNNDEQ